MKNEKIASIVMVWESDGWSRLRSYNEINRNVIALLLLIEKATGKIYER